MQCPYKCKKDQPKFKSSELPHITSIGAPKKASRATVQAMDQVYYSPAFQLKPRSSEEHEHRMLYVKLRRLEFLANYGDFSDGNCIH